MTDINRVSIKYEPWTDKFAFFMGVKDGNSMNVAESIVFRRLLDGEAANGPMIELSSDACQLMFNELWNAGFRPKDGTGNSGHLGALQYHLEDMRRLVFDERKLER